MREIKFCGKNLKTGNREYGFLYIHEPPIQCFDEGKPQEPRAYYIVRTAFADWNMPRQAEFIQIDPETAGQFTGLHDKNGKEIYESDIILYRFGDIKEIHMVVYEGYGISPFQETDEDGNPWTPGNEYCEVIGNIHENPELLNN